MCLNGFPINETSGVGRPAGNTSDGGFANWSYHQTFMPTLCNLNGHGVKNRDFMKMCGQGVQEYCKFFWRANEMNILPVHVHGYPERVIRIILTNQTFLTKLSSERMPAGNPTGPLLHFPEVNVVHLPAVLLCV